MLYSNNFSPRWWILRQMLYGNNFSPRWWTLRKCSTVIISVQGGGHLDMLYSNNFSPRWFGHLENALR